jgi:hypothetical protein
MRYIALTVVGFGIAVSVAACNQSGASVPTPAIVQVTALPPEASPTPIVCTGNPSGLTLDVQTSGFQRVRVVGRGFKSGESLLLIFTASTAMHSRRIEARPAQGVNADGTFAWDETLTPPADAEGSPVIWNVAVIHSRGVACATIKVF